MVAAVCEHNLSKLDKPLFLDLTEETLIPIVDSTDHYTALTLVHADHVLCESDDGAPLSALQLKCIEALCGAIFNSQTLADRVDLQALAEGLLQ